MIAFALLFLAHASADDLVIENIWGTASQVEMVRGDGQKQIPAIGAKAPQGTRFTIAAGTVIQVRLPDGSKVILRGNSDAGFHVLTPSQSEISLEQGRARATVPKVAPPSGARKFRFKTKAATMGVRGTDFTVEVKGEKLSVHVLDGTVDVARMTPEKPEFILAQAQALDLGPAPSPEDKPRAFDPEQFLKDWVNTPPAEVIAWWQRLWRWIVGLIQLK